MRFSLRIVLSAILLACLAPLPASAQTVTGTISGHVLDSTGAVIPNVKVVARNQETGLVREVTSDGTGFYFLNFLPLGAYQLTAAMPNFRTIEKRGVQVELTKNTVSDFTLEPASVAMEMVVTGEAAIINTSSSDYKTTLDEKTVLERPLQTRNFLMLAETLPGFQDNAVSGQNNPTVSSGSSMQFNGTGTRGTTFQIDGVNNDDASENQNRQGVNVSTIKEIQVLTNNFASEFGRGYGGVVLVQTKQGTNGLHGDAFFYEVNAPWGWANNYYANFNGTPIAKQRRHDFGGTTGGPIKKDKLFFFVSYEGVRKGGASSEVRSVFMPNERTPDASVTDTRARAFVESVIARFPAVSPNSPNLCPAPQSIKGTLDGQTYTVTQPCRVYTNFVKTSYPTEDGSGRLDWNINMFNTALARYQFSQQQTFNGTDWIKGQAISYNNRQQNVGITFTHIYSNRQTGEFRLGIGRRETQGTLQAGNDTPILRFGGTYGSIIGNAGNFPILRYQTDWQYVYNHSYVIDKWTFKAGTDIRPSQLNDFSDNYTRGYWSMGGPGWVQTAPGNNWEYRDGYWAFLHGYMANSSFSKGYGPAKLGNRLKEFNFYGQADYRATPSLTLNLGFRTEYVRAPREVKNLVDYGYGDSLAPEPRVGFAYSPAWTDGLMGKLTGGAGNSVIRGGFGLFHGRLFQSLFSTGGASIRFNPPIGAYIGFPQTATSNIADPTNGYTFSGGQNARVTALIVDPNLHLPYTEQWNLTLERKLPSQLGLSVAYIGNRGIGLPLYNGINRAQFPFTAPSGMFASDTMKKYEGVSFDCIDPNLNSATPISPSPGHQCISLGNLFTNARRPDPRFGGNLYLSNFSWSYYNALQVQLVKRPTRGLSFQANYTWSKTIDTGSEASTTNIDANMPYLQNDTAGSMRGLSIYDTPHRFTLNWGYQLPFFTQQKGFFGHVLGGWKWSGTQLWAAGNPFTVFVSQDLNADGMGFDRPTILDPSIYGRSVDNGHYVPGTKTTYSQNQLPVAAFYPNYTIPTASFGSAFNPGISNRGNEYRNRFRAAGRLNFDMALSKDVKIAEGKALQLRWDVYNVFNHVQFGYPSQTVTTSTFLQISGQRDNRGYFTDGFGGARFMQVALRLTF